MTKEFTPFYNDPGLLAVRALGRGIAQAQRTSVVPPEVRTAGNANRACGGDIAIQRLPFSMYRYAGHE
jgi:hypothetical protein